jgi:pentose-5-phosphate-3-epimerase
MLPLDGHVQVIEAGANAIVAGSAVFKAKSYRDGE